MTSPTTIPMHLVVHRYEDRQCVLVQEPPLAREREDIDGSNEPSVDIPPPPGAGLWVWDGKQELMVQQASMRGRIFLSSEITYAGLWRRPSVDEIGALIEGTRWPHGARLEADCSDRSE